jgi:crossover junction endodeoxyribonuclease RuvC
MLILGIDPSLSNTGIAILSFNKDVCDIMHASCVSTTTKNDIASRLNIIYNYIDSLLLNHRVNLVAIEKPYINNNYESSMKLSYVYGLILSLVAKHSLDYVEISPKEVKKFFTGYGSYDKNQIQYMINILISKNFQSNNEHENDAIAIAYSGKFKNQLNFNP